MTPYFFGYGSLVNRSTHAYPDAHPAQLQGWQRAWVRCEGRDTVFLSAQPAPDITIDGLIAAVPGDDWAALDERERGYARIVSGNAVVHPLSPLPHVAHYSVPPEHHLPDGDHVILLSYLDVVVQGFLREFGEKGVARFFNTTAGWNTPVLNDRAKPIYSRAQKLSDDETGLVNDHLREVDATLLQP
ncbi:gamma-glutamylcyclotransferase family protein [Sulfitobacter sp. JB4-11]|uniref:gamma-glutamylcyclotransferase family protein n=1 Tax=Sulfitobacter rhodophyticola TaxID=3238304 RepID=UPI003519C616